MGLTNKKKRAATTGSCCRSKQKTPRLRAPWPPRAASHQSAMGNAQNRRSGSGGGATAGGPRRTTQTSPPMRRSPAPQLSGPRSTGLPTASQIRCPTCSRHLVMPDSPQFYCPCGTFFAARATEWADHRRCVRVKANSLPVPLSLRRFACAARSARPFSRPRPAFQCLRAAAACI